MRIKCLALLAIILAIVCTGYSYAADNDAVDEHLILSGHAFAPQTMTVPANKKIKLIITNKDASAAEFESDDLRREKVVPANGEIYVYIGPLDPGTYDYYDDFHRTTATGTIIAKEGY